MRRRSSRVTTKPDKAREEFDDTFMEKESQQLELYGNIDDIENGKISGVYYTDSMIQLARCLLEIMTNPEEHITRIDDNVSENMAAAPEELKSDHNDPIQSIQISVILLTEINRRNLLRCMTKIFPNACKQHTIKKVGRTSISLSNDSSAQIWTSQNANIDKTSIQRSNILFVDIDTLKNPKIGTDIIGEQIFAMESEFRPMCVFVCLKNRHNAAYQIEGTLIGTSRLTRVLRHIKTIAIVLFVVIIILYIWVTLFGRGGRAYK